MVLRRSEPETSTIPGIVPKVTLTRRGVMLKTDAFHSGKGVYLSHMVTPLIHARETLSSLRYNEPEWQGENRVTISIQFHPDFRVILFGLVDCISRQRKTSPEYPAGIDPVMVRANVTFQNVFSEKFLPCNPKNFPDFLYRLLKNTGKNP